MRRRNYNMLFTLIAFLVISLVGLTIAFAAVSTTLTANTGTLTQSALTWDVGFNTGTISGTAKGTGVICGSGTASKTTISGMSVTFHNVGDKCSYYMQVKNNGTVGAKITSITQKRPTGISCTTPSSSTMVCGNITYRLRYTSSTSSSQPAVGDTLSAKTGSSAITRTIYLTAEYTGTSASTTDFTHSGFGFTITYGQN